MTGQSRASQPENDQDCMVDSSAGGTAARTLSLSFSAAAAVGPCVCFLSDRQSDRRLTRRGCQIPFHNLAAPSGLRTYGDSRGCRTESGGTSSCASAGGYVAQQILGGGQV